MDVADKRAQGGEVGGDRGDRKVVSTHGGDRATGVVATQRFFSFLALISVKKYCHHMILIWCPANSGSLYTMVPSDWVTNFV